MSTNFNPHISHQNSFSPNKNIFPKSSKLLLGALQQNEKPSFLIHLAFIGMALKKLTLQYILGALILCTVPVAAQTASDTPEASWEDFSDTDEQPSFPRGSANIPSDKYLDVPFLPKNAGLNKFLQSMDNHGVKPFVMYWGDFLANPVGGIKQNADWYQLVIFGSRFDLERLVGWKGAEFMISAADTAGDNLASDVGTIFTPSQAVSIRGFALYLVYLSQKFFDGKLEIRAGRMSTGSIFASLPIMGLPVSGAVNGKPISLFYNATGFHSTGKSTWAAAIKVKPTENTYLQTGIFQVNSRRENQSFYNGLDFSFRRGDGVILMAETGWSPTFGKEKASVAESDGKAPIVRKPEFAGLPGLYEFGGYLQNYSVPTFTGNSSVQNAYGFYWQGQQMLWRSRTNADHNFTLWGGVTYSPQTNIAKVPVMGYGGVAWSGLIPGRDKDQCLLNTYIGNLSRDFSQQSIAAGRGSTTTEVVFEASYIVQLTKQLQFQPDLQWFIQPGGHSNIPNSLVVGFQISFIF